ncbi:MAG: class I SAM-dependent methyltransferase [Chloroflexi bacterium]|nr:class I SAM-dependent methyltransferase [Chloroflexota bacterium]
MASTLPPPDDKPYGHPTRGNTARFRLRRVDTFLLLYDAGLFQSRNGSFFVDLGYGAEPFTTLESAARLRRINPRLPVLCVEIDPERVARAAPYADDLTLFRQGGFNLPLEPGETVRAVRAFNVLRQYDEDQVITAWRTVGRCLLPGGLLVEGTSDPTGRVWVANLLRRTESRLHYEGLLFSTNFRWGFAPEMFQPVLPKNCIHRMLPGERIFAFLDAWKRAAAETAAYQSWGLRQWFIASAERLAAYGFPVEVRRRWLRQGFLLWKDSPGASEIPL